MLTGATLFSGIGAPETAMPSWRWLWCAEIDKFPATVLAARHAPQVATTAAAVRRLTPRECERLQGFPDDYTLIQYRGRPAADGPRYKACGNSMAVPVMRWILGRIEVVDTILEADA